MLGNSVALLSGQPMAEYLCVLAEFWQTIPFTVANDWRIKIQIFTFSATLPYGHSPLGGFKCVRLDLVIYFEVTVRRNWQFRKVWYIKHLCIFCPRALDPPAIAAFTNLSVYFFSVTEWQLLEINLFVISLFFLFALLSCSDLPDSGAILQCIYIIYCFSFFWYGSHL